MYGTDNESPGNFHWCSNGREFEPKEITWAPGEPNSQFHCVYLKNLGVNKSVLATADCNTAKKFLCDVRKKGTGAKAMQQECMEIWGITASRSMLQKLQRLFLSSLILYFQFKIISFLNLIYLNLIEKLKLKLIFFFKEYTFF